MASSPIDSSERFRMECDVYDSCARSVEGANLLISAFVQALRSSRRSSVCAPFPGFLMKDWRNKDFRPALEAVMLFPPVQEVASSEFGSGSKGADHPLRKIPLQALTVLHWILRFRYHIELVKDPEQEFSISLLPRCPWGTSKLDISVDRGILPSFVLKVQEVIDEMGSMKRVSAFEEVKAQHGTIMAFHGTQAENLHSILRCGLLNMSKTVLQRNGAMFGEGVYLSTDLAVAVTFSRPGESWEHSFFGPRVRYVLLCEVAKGEGVVCSSSSAESQETRTIDTGTKHQAKGSVTRIHGTYIVVQNSDFVRVRYVLVYCDSSRTPVESHQNVEVRSPVPQVYSRWHSSRLRGMDRATLVILLYVTLLIVLGLSEGGLKKSRVSVVLQASRLPMLLKQLRWPIDKMRLWIDSWALPPTNRA